MNTQHLMRALFHTILLVLIASTPCFSQSDFSPAVRDSLWKSWIDESNPDPSRLQAISLLIKKGYLFSQPDSAIYFAGLLMQQGELQENDVMVADALNFIGSAHYVKGDAEEAISYFEKCLAMRLKLDDQKNVAGTLNNIGTVYFRIGKYVEAIEYFERSLSAKEAIGDPAGLPSTLNNIANILVNQGDYTRAMELNLRSLRIREELEDLEGVASSLNNIGIIHGEMGDYQNALEHFKRSLAIKEQFGNVREAAGSHGNIAMIYVTLGNAEDALKSFDQALNAYIKLGDRRGEASTLVGMGDFDLTYGNHAAAKERYSNALILYKEIQDSQGIAAVLGRLANVHAELKEVSVAITYGEQALALAEVSGLVSETKDAAEILYRLYKDKGAFQPALNMFELFVSMRDSVVGSENQREIMRQQFQYDYEKREAEIRAEQEMKNAVAHEEMLRQRSERNLMGLGFMLFILVGGTAGISLHQRRKAVYRYRSASLELKALRAQMKPHFIFNALNSIHQFIDNNNPAVAKDYLVKFSKHMRATLNNTLTDEVTVEDEVEALREYMELEKANLPGQLNYEIDIDPAIDVENTILPPLMIQPFIENAVMHGIAPKKDAGTIRVRMSKQGNSLHVSVTDDGIGRKKSAQRKGKNGHASVGLKLTQERMEKLNRDSKIKTGITFTDLEQGLRVDLVFPFKERF